MGLESLPDAYWTRLSPFIAGAMGLHFARERWSDLQRGLAGAAQEFGFEDVAACADWLLSSPLGKEQLQVLASHLTIGETYFFRDKPTLAALSEHVLPELIRARRGGEQRLRIWSAACCSGEEPYTLAMLLHQLLPDLADWRVTIRATDINQRFLRKAAAGIYGEWSFRDAPEGLKERHFRRTPDGRYAVNPEVRRMVSFSHLNLVEDAYPSPVADTNAMDLICCRNVLMYFTPEQIEKVIGKLRHALVDRGWLAVAPSEASQALFARFAMVNFPGAILYQKSDAAPWVEQRETPTAGYRVGEFVAPISRPPTPWALPALPLRPPPVLQPQYPAPAENRPAAALPPMHPVPTHPALTPYAVAESLYGQGRYADAADTLTESFARGAPEPQAFSLMVRAHANQGRLADALAWCDRWIAADKVDSAAHYLRAVVLLERGELEQAWLSLQRVLYLDQGFALAHFALGNLARGRGRNAEADRHFANALHTLRRLQPDELLPESDGLTAGRLIEIISAMSVQENAR